MMSLAYGATFLKSADFCSIGHKNLCKVRPGWTNSNRSMVKYLVFQIDFRCHQGHNLRTAGAADDSLDCGAADDSLSIPDSALRV
ncbi:hypothetical protein ES705_20373 [subsurface metagenome]